MTDDVPWHSLVVKWGLLCITGQLVKLELARLNLKSQAGQKGLKFRVPAMPLGWCYMTQHRSMPDPYALATLENMSTCEGHIRCLPCSCGMVTVIRRVSFSPSRCEQAEVNRKKFLAVQMSVAASSACLRPSCALRCLPSSEAALRKKRSKEQFCRGRHFVCAR